MVGGEVAAVSINSAGNVVAGAATVAFIKPSDNNSNDVTGNRGRSKHAQQRANEGRSVSPARNDAQKAKPADILRQDDGRWVVKGKNGRIHIFESDGEHVTTFKNPSRNTNMRIRRGDWFRPSYEEIEQFKKIFGQ
jgi:hypothetical protein